MDITDKIDNQIENSRWLESIEQLNRWAAKDIVRRIVTADFQMTGTAELQIYMLRESGYHLAELQNKISLVTKRTDAEVRQLFRDIGNEELQNINSALTRADIEPFQGLSKSMQNVVESAYIQTGGELKNILNTTASQSQGRFVEELDKAFFRVKSGQQSYSQAITEMVKDVAKDGLYIGYPTGHKDKIEVAVRRALFAGMNQSAIKLLLQTAAEIGHDAFLVSQHLGARTGGKESYEDHESWQGLVYSREKLEIVCGLGKGGGLGGWGCRHHIDLYFEGITEIPKPLDPAENRRIENLQKECRRRERNIRSIRRELIGLNVALEEGQDEQYLQELQLQYDRTAARLKRSEKKYKDFCESNGLKPYNERLQLPGWDRKQSMKAVQRAKKII